MCFRIGCCYEDSYGICSKTKNEKCPLEEIEEEIERMEKEEKKQHKKEGIMEGEKKVGVR